MLDSHGYLIATFLPVPTSRYSSHTLKMKTFLIVADSLKPENNECQMNIHA